MVPVKSSMGLISSKISSSPDCSGRFLWPAFFSASSRDRQRSLPSSQSKDSVCRARRLGTSRGSSMRAKETRWGPETVAEALREAANRGPSELDSRRGASRARETPCGYAAGECWGAEDEVGAAQIGSVVEGHTAGQL